MGELGQWGTALVDGGLQSKVWVKTGGQVGRIVHSQAFACRMDTLRDLKLENRENNYTV